MELGLLTACFPNWTLERVAQWASSVGISSLEIAAWPTKNRDFTATHLALDAEGGLDAARVAAETIAKAGVRPSCIAYYDNNLHPDEKIRARTHEHLARCIQAAPLLGCPLVGTFIGRNPGKTFAENLRDAERIFPALAQRAGEVGVKLVIENFPM